MNGRQGFPGVRTMGFLRRLTVFLAMLLVAAGGAGAAQEAPAPSGRAMLWKVQGPAGESAYLLGSIHLLRDRAYQNRPSFRRAFEETEALALEVDMGEMAGPRAQRLFAEMGTFSSGAGLRKSLPPEVYARVEGQAKALGLPMEILEPMRPWLCSLTLTSVKLLALGFDPENGVDLHFYRRAIESERPLHALETVEYQVGLFADLPPKVQAEMLEQTLEELEGAEGHLGEIVLAWETGDTTAMEKLLLSGLRDYPQLQRMMITDRNRAWMEKLEELMSRKKPLLVVVGTAHMVGPDGLVSLLRGRGYRVEQQ